MPVDYLISNGEKAPIGAIRTFDPGLFAETRDPFIGAGGRVAGLARLSTLESPGIDILPPPEKRTKQSDFGAG